MEFTEQEIAFLTQHHTQTIETATRNKFVIEKNRIMEPCVDLRQLGCPPSLFFRVLERRAKKLGSLWMEFRAKNHSAAPTSETSDLDVAVAGTKLF
jgi:hypothetical protein